MNSPENQPESQPESQFDPNMTYFDPEQVDTSEQEFAVSLEHKTAPPAFEVESEAEFAPHETASNQAGSRYLSLQPSPIAGMQKEAQKKDDVVGDKPAKIPEQQDPAESGPDWRDLVSAKVNSYRSRRPRKDHYPSLQLQFDPEPVRHQPKEEELPAFAAPVVRQPAPPVEVPVTRTAHPISLETTARVLEFPRPAAPPVRTDELADPVLDRPRIIEAPELLPPPPAMGGIMIEPAEPVAERRPGFEVPLQSATLNRRVTAALADVMVVAGASALFGFIVLRIVGTTPPLRAAAIFLGGMFALLWTAYQYTFLTYCGKTPGLLAARLEIRKFDGVAVSRSLRRWRALASILSLASLCLGYAWCFFDEDQLSWHDRITRTHLAQRSPEP